MQSLFSSIISSPARHDWLYFAVRWLLLIAIALMVFVFRQFNTQNINDILIALGIGAVANIILAIFAGIKQTREVAPYIGMAGDWVMAGVFIRITGSDPQQVLSIIVIFIALGFMRYRSPVGLVQISGVLVATIIALVTLNSPDWLTRSVINYMPAILSIIMLSIVGAVWIYFDDELQEQGLKEERKRVEKQAKSLAHFRESSHALSEMAMELNSTLQYNRILDAALSVGRITVQSDNKHRLISMVLLYTYDNRLEIANSQGLSLADNNKILPGKAGIIAETLTEMRPIFGGSARKDPELRGMLSFQNVRSLLCIPLRAGYDNYGVLLFGSEGANAFSKDQLESLRVIGTQATIALQNSVLYQNLMDEKERIIALQDDARKDLVRDLHDVPTQTISAVAMRLAIIPKILERDPSKVAEEVEDIRNMTLRAVEEIRHVMFKLRPLILESRGLGAGLEQLAEKMEQTYQQPMKTYCEKQIESLLDVNQKGAIFHLIEEAANNARKYAEASMIRASVTVQEDSIVVKVVDNGKGFDVEKVQGGYDSRGSFGMVNMRERAELLDGMLDLKSIPGKGTQITAFIPIPHGKPATKPIEELPAHIPHSKLSLAALEKN